MVKRLIFDLDDTLIIWQNKYREAIKKTVETYKLDINYLDVDKIIETYENYYDKYKKENMLELINKKLNLNLKEDFIDKWLYELGYMADYDKEVDETLKYLASKYELVVLTNWFADPQSKRLENAGIRKYFTKIYGGEECIKPNRNSYEKAIGECKIDECIMIGDNYNIDIMGAKNIGMKVIQVDYKNKINEERTYKIIKRFNELKDLL